METQIQTIPVPVVKDGKVTFEFVSKDKVILENKTEITKEDLSTFFAQKIYLKRSLETDKNALHEEFSV